MKAVTFCKHCGNILNISFNFCPFCGIPKKNNVSMEEIVDTSLQRIKERNKTNYLKRLDHLEEQLRTLEKELDSIIILKKQ
jgi:RNA polymerase subunit RPABC4/transcription elongation factor Spt4